MRMIPLITKEHASYLWHGAKSWWDEVDDSEAWQDSIYYLLCAAYALVGGIAIIQLIRIQYRLRDYGWTTQKVFHLMNFIVNGARAVVFGLHGSVFAFKHWVFTAVLLDLPGLIFFSTYTLLILFWAEIYHKARNISTNYLRPGFLTINAVIYLLQIFIWIYEGVSENIIQALPKIFFAAISFVAALGFLTYGGRLFLMLRRFPLESKGRRKKLYEVGFVTAICFSCFAIRCVIVALSAFDSDLDLDVLNHPILNLIYYVVVEILPSALVLFILRKLPAKRISDQYRPIG